MNHIALSEVRSGSETIPVSINRHLMIVLFLLEKKAKQKFLTGKY
jgi:hypothetical protein